MSARNKSYPTLRAPEGYHFPFCRICGWRMGGVDSWDGRACKCGKTSRSVPIVPVVIPIERERQS